MRVLLVDTEFSFLLSRRAGRYTRLGAHSHKMELMQNSQLLALPAEILYIVCEFLVFCDERKHKHPILVVYCTCRQLRDIITSQTKFVKNRWVCQEQLSYGTPEYARWYIKKYVDMLASLDAHKHLNTRIRELKSGMAAGQLMRIYTTGQKVLPVAGAATKFTNRSLTPADITPEELSEGTLPTHLGCFSTNDDYEASRVYGLRLRKTSIQRYEDAYRAFYELVSGPRSMPDNIYTAIQECQQRFLILIENISVGRLSWHW